MAESIKRIFESNPSVDDLCNAATLRINAVAAMARQVGGEDFAEWNDAIRTEYGHGMAMMLDDVIDLVCQLHKQAHDRPA